MKNNYTSQFKKISFFCLLSLFSFGAFAQVGIGTTNPNPNSKLDITSTVAEPGGLLLPRVALTGTANIAPLAAHVAGMAVYNTATAGDVTPGYYYNDGSKWVRIAAASVPSSDWTVLGNTGLNATNNFLGTTDNVALRFRTTSFNRFEITNGTTQANGGRLRAFTDGDAATPIYSWNANVGTGMFQQAANVIGFSTNTTERFRIPNADQVHAVADGTAALPFYSWSSDTGIGMYRAGANLLGFSTTGNERMRILADGRVTVNNTGAYAFMLNSSASGSAGAIIGASENGTAVHGQATGTGYGVVGLGIYGTYGSGIIYGSYGLVDNDTGMGMRARNLNATGTGLLASGNNATGSYLPNGSGIAGSGDTGVYGNSTNSNGTGITGVGNNGLFSVVSPSGSGISGTGTKLGVFGYAGNGSVANGNRGNHAGEFTLDADNDPTTNTGNNGNRATAILAGFNDVSPNGTLTSRDSYYGGYFSGGSESSNTPSYAYVGMRYRTNNNGDGVITNPGTTGRDYKIIGTGVVSTLIKDEKGTPRVLFAPEAPEVVFQDYGIGQLVNGEARILIDPLFKRGIHVDDESPLKVYVTLEGDCNGVYVTNKSADGFTVRELQSGTSNAPFSWQIVATRADTKNAAGEVVSKYVGVRLPEGPGPLEVKAKKVDVIKAPKVENTLNDVIKSPINNIGASAATINNDTQSQSASNAVEVKAGEDNITAPSKTLKVQENK